MNRYTTVRMPPSVPVGTKEKDQSLSEKRAEALKYLSESGNRYHQVMHTPAPRLLGR